MSVVRVNQIQDTSTNVAANISGGIVTFTNPPVGTGKVLQVINVKRETTVPNITSTTQVSILTASITPKSTSSRIMITAMAAGQTTTGSSGIFDSRIYRGGVSGTVVSGFYEGMGETTANQTHYITANHTVTDSPNTTNATTYTFSLGTGSGGTTNVKFFGNAGNPITMSLMEIA